MSSNNIQSVTKGIQKIELNKEKNINNDLEKNDEKNKISNNNRYRVDNSPNDIYNLDKDYKTNKYDNLQWLTGC